MSDAAASSSKSSSSVTVVVSALVVLAVVGIAGWLFLRAPRNTVPPEEAARAWAEKLKLPLRGAACTMFDSDDDGYVSCVLALDGPDKVCFQGLQCGELNSRKGGGCKPDAKNPEVHLVFELSSKLPAPTGAPVPTIPR